MKVKVKGSVIQISVGLRFAVAILFLFSCSTILLALVNAPLVVVYCVFGGAMVTFFYFVVRLFLDLWLRFRGRKRVVLG